MADQIIFWVKGILLTEALTHAVRSWRIFDEPRAWLVGRSNFLSRLLPCFECTSVWVATAVVIYLYFVDFWPFVLIIISQRLASILNIGVTLLDAKRAKALNDL